MQRTNMSRTEIEQRISNQLSDETLSQKSDFVIINDEKKALLPQIVELTGLEPVSKRGNNMLSTRLFPLKFSSVIKTETTKLHLIC